MTLETADETAPGQIRIYKTGDFEGMRRAGRLAAECLDMLQSHVAPGVSTERLDDLAREFILDNGALPACLGYKGYWKTTCISRNHVVCHGVPGAQNNLRLNEGDIVNIDVTCILDGWHGDTSRMYPVGEISPKARRLIEVTHEALMLGVAAAKPGNTFGDIGEAIQRYAEVNRCSVVEDFCGHGTGTVFHQPPNVLHYRQSRLNPRQRIDFPEIRPGMIFTIEPMINLGRPATKVLPDGWTAVTRDKSLSAQFEHCVGISEDGPEVFTYSPAGLHKPGL